MQSDASGDQGTLIEEGFVRCRVCLIYQAQRLQQALQRGYWRGPTLGSVLHHTLSKPVRPSRA